jgi:endonuclease YncB( thermonuclease family)
LLLTWGAASYIGVMSRKSQPFRRRSGGARVPILIAVAAALLIGVPAVRGAMEQNAPPPGGKIVLQAKFDLCHEGGGRNCVVDGDTVWIAGEKVRIAGIDAPETHEFKCPAEAELGRRSALRLQALLSSGRLVATPADRDRDPNGRLLRNITVDGRDVGRTLIGEGLARAYRGGKKSWCN